MDHVKKQHGRDEVVTNKDYNFFWLKDKPTVTNADLGNGSDCVHSTSNVVVGGGVVPDSVGGSVVAGLPGGLKPLSVPAKFRTPLRHEPISQVDPEETLASVMKEHSPAIDITTHNPPSDPAYNPPKDPVGTNITPGYFLSPDPVTPVLNVKSFDPLKKKKAAGGVTKKGPKKGPKKATKKVNNFNYFEGYTTGNMSIEGLFSLVSASSKKVKSDNVISKKDAVSTPDERDLPTSSVSTISMSSLSTPISQPQAAMGPGPSTSNSLPYSTNSDKEDLTPSRNRKKTHKSRLRCDDPNCTPCSVLANCRACFNCLNRSKLR